MEKKSYESPKAGIFYMVPNPKKPGKYTLISEIEEEGSDPIHLNLWDHVHKMLEVRFKRSVGDAYTGIPRGRILTPSDPKGVWYITHGNDFPIQEYKSEIFSEFSLRDAEAIGKVEFRVENHEKMDPREKRQIESDLGIVFNSTGWKWKK